MDNLYSEECNMEVSESLEMEPGTKFKILTEEKFQNEFTLTSDQFQNFQVEEPCEGDFYQAGASGELTDLLPMQPVDEKLQTMIDQNFDDNVNPSDIVMDINEDDVAMPSELACEFVTEEKNSPYICHSATDEGDTETPQVYSISKVSKVSKPKHTQEEIINQLLEDKISFRQVADLLGEDNEEKELEDAIAEDEEDCETKEDHAEAFEKELNEQQKYHLKRRGGKERRRRKRLPAALQGLMGEANLRYARHEYNEAIKMCMEIIRQHSNSYEPYQLLGTIYEDQNLVDKSLQFLLIAAFLSPNAEEWEKLAELSITQLNDTKQAVFCYGRAIRANPYNLDNHWTRCSLLENLGEKTKALKGYIHMVKFLGEDQGEDGLKLAKEIAKIHFENGSINLAQDAMETAFKKYPLYVTHADSNLMLEVLMQMEQYATCVSILVDYNKVELKPLKLSAEEFQKLSIKQKIGASCECLIPPDLPSELRAKLSIAFIHLKCFPLAEPLVETITKEPIDKFGDLYLEISEAYSKTDSQEKALPLLESLLKTKEFNVAAVWLLYGECLAANNRLEEASSAYDEVVAMAPQHGEARLISSSILLKLNRPQDAVLVLDQAADGETLNSSLLYQKCQLLLQQNYIKEFIETAKLLFYRHFVYVRSQEEAEKLLGIKKLSNKFEALRDLRKGKKESIEDNKHTYVGNDVSLDDQWKLFVQVCEILYERKSFAELERLTFSALGSKEFMKDKDRSKELGFLCLIACMESESYYFAYNIVRQYIIKNQENNRYWNILCFIISKADDFRHNKFLLRLTVKHPDSLPLMMLNGHNCLVAGTYKFSLAEYSAAFKQDPNNPLVSLMLGLIYTHMACQKFSGKKHSLVVQACAFLNTYLELRTNCQESFYNLGRAMHQLNLLPEAIHYYKKALEMPKPECHPDGPDLDLSREIAFNLHLIYKKSGNLDIARFYINKYIKM